MFKCWFSCPELQFMSTFVSVPCDLGEFHTRACAPLWVLLLHFAEMAIRRNSLVATFPFMFSSMSRCWYKLPPRVTPQILNTCLALINSSQVFQAPWKCYLSFFFSPYQLPWCQFDSLNNKWTDLWLYWQRVSSCFQRGKWPGESFWTSWRGPRSDMSLANPRRPRRTAVIYKNNQRLDT